MRRMIMALGAVATGGIVSLLLAELVVRTFLPQWSDQWKMWRIDPVYARGLEPSVEAAVVHGHSNEFAFAFSTNAQGLRMDTDLDPDRRADQDRVVLVGDSFTFGYGVGQDETFAAELQRQLDRSGPATEVINAGFASGFTLDTEYLFVREVASEWQPDQVVVGVCLDNDLSDLDQTLWQVEGGHLEAIRKNNDHIPVWVKMSAIVNLIVKGAVPAFHALRAQEAHSSANASAEELAPACELPTPRSAASPATATGRALRQEPPGDAERASAAPPAKRVDWLMQSFAHHAVTQDYDLTVMLIPSAYEVQWSTTPETLSALAHTRDVFAAAARRAGVRVIDPVAEMRAFWCEHREALYFHGDGHWNASGHRFIGNWLHQMLFPDTGGRS